MPGASSTRSSRRNSDRSRRLCGHRAKSPCGRIARARGRMIAQRGNPMKRSEFLARVAGGAFAVSTSAAATDEGPFVDTDIHVERAAPGKPHAGNVRAAIQPHADDLPLFAGGLVFKLM